ncbi:MAG TPA: proline--tRNA ligase [Flavobacteriaceae bacterium]|nr:proline--tRNA ligase [Flavobacteriaceae bacterium]
MGNKITSRKEDYSKWYNDIVINADLAENSEVRGCMVIKPYGFSIWELMKKELDKMFKDTGHQNAYFPLFVPKSLFEAEEKNAEGFAKECAIVTHYRLKNDPDNKGKLILDPESKLEEELIVRPTSEAVIWKTYKKWIQSYRDLPILINQWANVVRWEMRTRLFLRTSEFLWQEGHTAHSTKDEAMSECLLINNIYAEFAEKFMAMPVLKGSKSEAERFAGAEETLCIEALMQDGKALQAGTSHFLGQNFAKAFDVKFADKSGKLDYVWATSWGVSTRLMGALIMTHSDDKGLVLPPNLAPTQVVIIPMVNSDESKDKIEKTSNKIFTDLKSSGIRVTIDSRENFSLGYKLNDYELKGVPLRLVIGQKEIENDEYEIFSRDDLNKQKSNSKKLTGDIIKSLDNVQNRMLAKAKKRLNDNTHQVSSYDNFKELIENQKGFISCGWDGDSNTEESIKKETKATIRCIVGNGEDKDLKCIYSGKPAKHKVIFAKSY